MKECVAAVGTFDGIHIGHKKILDTVVREARERGMESRAITFLNHPLEVLAPEKMPPLLLTREDNSDRLSDLVDRVSEMNFTKELAAMTAAEFLKLIAGRYNVKVLVMGYDNSFGSDRLKSRDEYRQAAAEAGVELIFVEAAKLEDGTIVSSSEVRRALAGGDITQATKMLDGIYEVEGTVVRGKRNGHRIGFPTMNIDRTGLAPLATGVYLCIWEDNDALGEYDYQDDAPVKWPALLSVGHNPTIGDHNPLTYELHVLGKKVDSMYGHLTSCKPFFRLRDEGKFDSVKELKHAIRNDIYATATIMHDLWSEDENFFCQFDPDAVNYILNMMKRACSELKAEKKRLQSQLRKNEDCIARLNKELEENTVALEKEKADADENPS